MISNIHSTIVIVASILASALTAMGILTTFVNVYAQGEGANQTTQQKDPEQSANQTMEKAIQSANETGKDVKQTIREVGSKITEGAKDLAGNIGEKLENIRK